MALLKSTTTEGLNALESILEYDRISLDTVTLDEGQNLTAGTVLGQITTGDTAEATAFASNTGDGAMGEITVSAGAIAGTYKLVVIAEATDAGTFTVTDPNGIFVATGTVDAEFDAGGLTFTLADGTEDFNIGDGFDIVVAAGSGNYTLHDAAATDGSQVARAILAYDSDATDGDLPVVAITRLAEVKESLLTWKTGISAPNKAAGIAALASHYIIAR